MFRCGFGDPVHLRAATRGQTLDRTFTPAGIVAGVCVQGACDTMALRRMVSCRNELGPIEAEATLFKLCSHDHSDMTAYANHIAGELLDQPTEEAALTKALSGLRSAPACT
jgi:hypothetical protein